MGTTKAIRTLTARTTQIERDFRIIRERERSPWVRHMREQNAQQKLPSYFTAKITTVQLERLVEKSHARVALRSYHRQTGWRLPARVVKLKEAIGSRKSSLDKFQLYYEEDRHNGLQTLRAAWKARQVRHAA